MEFHFLGTASGYPSPKRGASGLVLQNLLTGSQWLFDCGEGSQIQAQRHNSVKIGIISNIFISHTHGDHMYGLPGLLCTIAQKYSDPLLNTDETNRPADVNIYGPKGLRRFLRLALAISSTRLNFKYSVHELIFSDEQKPENWKDFCSLEINEATDPALPEEIPGMDFYPDSNKFWLHFQTICDEKTKINYKISAVALKHTIPSLGWLIQETDHPPSLNADKARQLGVTSGKDFGLLKSGLNITLNDNVILAKDVLEEPKKGLNIAIMGDSYDSDDLGRLVRFLGLSSIDTLVHECTFDDSMVDEAIMKGHSTPKYVKKLASDINAQTVILTHFSHRYSRSNEMNNKNEKRLTLEEISRNFEESSFEIIFADDLRTIKLPRKIEQ